MYGSICFQEIFLILSVIRQKGESQNGCSKKTKHVKLSKRRTFLTLLIRTRTCAYQGVRNVRFSEILACFVFLKHLFWDSPFALLPMIWFYGFFKRLLSLKNDNVWKCSLFRCNIKTQTHCVSFMRYSVYYLLSHSIKLTSWSVLVEEVEYNFNYIFWILYHLVMKLGQLINKVIGMGMGKHFA